MLYLELYKHVYQLSLWVLIKEAIFFQSRPWSIHLRPHLCWNEKSAWVDDNELLQVVSTTNLSPQLPLHLFSSAWQCYQPKDHLGLEHSTTLECCRQCGRDNKVEKCRRIALWSKEHPTSKTSQKKKCKQVHLGRWKTGKKPTWGGLFWSAGPDSTCLSGYPSISSPTTKNTKKGNDNQLTLFKPWTIRLMISYLVNVWVVNFCEEADLQ